MSMQSPNPNDPPAWVADQKKCWGEMQSALNPETFIEVFERRLKDGTAWTEGFTEEEINLPLKPVRANSRVQDPEDAYWFEQEKANDQEAAASRWLLEEG